MLTPLLGIVHGAITTELRKAAKCPYPNGYASAQEMKSNVAAYRFNCAQRAHTQFMENAPQTILSMLVTGLVYPNATAVLGFGWFAARVLYLSGYIWGSLEKGRGRRLGFSFWLFQLSLWGLAVMTAKNLLL